MASGEWRVASGEWRVASGEQYTRVHKLKFNILFFFTATFLFISNSVIAGSDKGGSDWQNIAPKSYPLERQWVSSDQFPWRAIGRVNLAGRGHCTGTLIATDKVLTSAHCLWNRQTARWYPAQFITFVAGAEKEDFQDYSKVSDYLYPSAFNPEALDKPALLKHDWAILTLQKPIGQQLGFLTFSNNSKLRRNQSILQAGYRADRAFVLTVQQNCAIDQLYDNDNIFRTTCHTLGGDSGGPVLIKSGNNWSLAGIHRGRTEKNQSLVVSIQNFAEQL